VFENAIRLSTTSAPRSSEKTIIMSSSSPESLRLFFAVALSNEVVESISEFSGKLASALKFTGCEPKWVSSNSYHITLWFIGNVPKEMGKRLAGRMPTAVSGIEPFEIDVRHTGFFPHAAAPRVLWLGLGKVPPELTLLQERATEIARLSGLPIDKAFNFTPHITLARLKGARNIRAMGSMLENYKHFRAGKCIVDRLILMQSTPHKGGSIYTPFAETKFANAPGTTEAAQDE